MIKKKEKNKQDEVIHFFNINRNRESMKRIINKIRIKPV